MQRRAFITAAAGWAAASTGIARAQAPGGHAGHGGYDDLLYERLDRPGRTGLPPLAATQALVDSPAPPAPSPGRWASRAPLPLARSEMAWAAARAGRMHVVGGYAEQRVDRPYHHVYDAGADRWSAAAPLPLGANHVGVAFLGERLYAVGGFVEQNRRPHAECFAWESGADRWTRIAPLPEACGAIGCVAAGGVLHAVGGAVGDTFETKKSLDRHLVYDEKADRWERRAPLPTGRDHVGIVAFDDGALHVVGGRVDSFATNSDLHHAWDAARDRWTPRRPMPTPRSGHGAVVLRGRMFVMGGEGTNRVFGQNESYDPGSDAWLRHAPMPTPRHGLGAAVLGDAIHVAGGGPVNGGAVQSAVHEAFVPG